MQTYGSLYKAWERACQPSANVARMMRSTLIHLARVLWGKNWTTMAVIPEAVAMVQLDALLDSNGFTPRSKANYRTNLRRLYKFAAEEGLDCSAGVEGLWPAVSPDAYDDSRVRAAYRAWVAYAVAQGIGPAATSGDRILAWALDLRKRGDANWRGAYHRLESVWATLVAAARLPEAAFPPLPAPKSQRYAIALANWPEQLRSEWLEMCRQASSHARKGRRHPWRADTLRGNQERLARFLGWYLLAHPDADLTPHTWATLLTLDRCVAYIDWLIERTGDEVVNSGHTAILRTIRGFHQQFFGSAEEILKAFDEQHNAYEVAETQHAAKMVPYPRLREVFGQMLAEVEQRRRLCRTPKDRKLWATSLVDLIIFGILHERALRSKNIRTIRLGTNLHEIDGKWMFHFRGHEMKNHKAFETSLPKDLVEPLKAYLEIGFRVLTGRDPEEGDELLRNRKGRPFEIYTFHDRVKAMTHRWLGKRIHPHLFRHMLATRGAQTLHMSPKQLAAMLSHKSIRTVMKYYEITSPLQAAEAFDGV